MFLGLFFTEAASKATSNFLHRAHWQRTAVLTNYCLLSFEPVVSRIQAFQTISLLYFLFQVRTCQLHTRALRSSLPSMTGASGTPLSESRSAHLDSLADPFLVRTFKPELSSFPAGAQTCQQLILGVPVSLLLAHCLNRPPSLRTVLYCRSPGSLFQQTSFLLPNADLLTAYTSARVSSPRARMVLIGVHFADL